MKFTKEEIVGISVSILVALGFFAVLRFDDIKGMVMRPDTGEGADTQEVVALGTTKDAGSLTQLLTSALSSRGHVEKLITQDSKEGTGKEVVTGSRVTVHYIGSLQDGAEFDNSYAKGTPFTFVIGRGEVIAGWDKGLLGMKEGGERILIVPSDMAYGDRAVGIIPKNSTLLFAVEVLSVE